MIRLMYERTEISTGDTIKFCHRCLTESVLEQAFIDYYNIDTEVYTKAKLIVVRD